MWSRQKLFFINNKQSAWKGTPFVQATEENKYIPVLEHMDRHFICPDERE